MPKILCLAGSQREGSYNRHLLDHLIYHLSPGATVEVPKLDALRLPLFDQSFEKNASVMDSVRRLHATLSACDGLMVASPEYNGQLTPFLKNLVDWLSRIPYIEPGAVNAFLDKPVLLASASTGRSGGFASIAHARALFGHVGALVLGGAICIPSVEQCWAGYEFEFSPDFQEFTASMVQRLERISSARAKNFL